MVRERTKRKERDEEGEEGEEEKREKFFALIRSMKEVRKLILRASDKSDPPDRQKNINEKEKSVSAGAWIPVFRPEDFMEDGGPAAVINDQADPPGREGKNEEREEENKENDEDSGGDDEKGRDSLNLKLSL